MKPLLTDGNWSILVYGEVSSPTVRGVQDRRKLLPGFVAITKPPAGVIFQVDYRLVEHPTRKEW